MQLSKIYLEIDFLDVGDTGFISKCWPCEPVSLHQPNVKYWFLPFFSTSSIIILIFFLFFCTIFSHKNFGAFAFTIKAFHKTQIFQSTLCTLKNWKLYPWESSPVDFFQWLFGQQNFILNNKYTTPIYSVYYLVLSVVRMELKYIFPSSTKMSLTEDFGKPIQQ